MPGIAALTSRITLALEAVSNAFSVTVKCVFAGGAACPCVSAFSSTEACIAAAAGMANAPGTASGMLSLVLRAVTNSDVSSNDNAQISSVISATDRVLAKRRRGLARNAHRKALRILGFFSEKDQQHENTLATQKEKTI